MTNENVKPAFPLPICIGCGFRYQCGQFNWRHHKHNSKDKRFSLLPSEIACLMYKRIYVKEGFEYLHYEPSLTGCQGCDFQDCSKYPCPNAPPSRTLDSFEVESLV